MSNEEIFCKDCGASLEANATECSACGSGNIGTMSMAAGQIQDVSKPAPRKTSNSYLDYLIKRNTNPVRLLVLAVVLVVVILDQTIGLF